MSVRKFILLIFVLFSLNYSFTPGNLFSKEKEAIVLILNLEKDDATREFVKRNEAKKFQSLISLSMKIAIVMNAVEINNSS